MTNKELYESQSPFLEVFYQIMEVTKHAQRIICVSIPLPRGLLSNEDYLYLKNPDCLKVSIPLPRGLLSNEHKAGALVQTL